MSRLSPRAILRLGPSVVFAALFAYLSFAAAPPATLLGQTLDEFAARREALRKAVGDAVVLIASPSGGDYRLRFRPATNVVYLTGVDQPGCVVALLPEGDPLGVPCAVFLRTRGGLDEVKQRTGISAVYSSSTMWETLKASLEKASAVYVEGPVGEAGRQASSAALVARIKEIKPSISINDIRPAIARLRLRKSSGEVGNVRAAIHATIAGFQRAASVMQAGVTELAIEGEILAGIRRAGAASEGFPSIVASGPNALILHHDPTSRPLQRGEAVVVDIGAEVNYYSADLTRTFPVGGRFTPRVRALYQAVLDTQKACERAIVPGKTTWSDLNSLARQFLRDHPLKAADTSGELRSLDRFFTHSIGHWLGMEVHDVGPPGSPLVPGSVITIEPGVYIPSENIGIRIEDDYLVTEDGVERLSARLPSDPADVERMMRR